MRRVSAYLVEGDYDLSPIQLRANSKKAFIGSIILGMGFTFDDENSSKGEASSLSDMKLLLESNPDLQKRINPYIGGEEINNDPQQSNRRFAFNLSDLTEAEAAIAWPQLLSVARQRVKPKRDTLKRAVYRENWWRFGEPQTALYAAMGNSRYVFAISRVTPHLAFARLPAGMIYADSTVVLVQATSNLFSVVQSRIHEAWARFFSSSMKDDLRYAPSDCFRTFPFPEGFERDATLEAAGDSYQDFRAQLMIDRSEGLTKTYNRFHARGENSPDIARLRELHAAMDAVVLRAYGWDDLAACARPEFIEQEADEGKTPKTRLDWPAEFKDQVLARLLALNAARAAAERAAGLAVAPEDDEELVEEESEG